MFERFTEAARRTLFFARFEVTQLGATAIEPHHILLGLMRESRGLVPRIFERSHVSPATLRKQIEAKAEFREAIPTSVEVPFNAATKRVLQYAADEADQLRHSYIGTEHLLLALLREEGSEAASLLRAQGLQLGEARKALVDVMQVVRSEQADHSEELERLAQIKQSAHQLARLAPDNNATRTLVHQIEGNLDALMRYFRR